MKKKKKKRRKKEEGGDGEDNYSLSAGAIVGIIFAVLVVIALILGIYCFIRRNRLKNNVEGYQVKRNPFLKNRFY